jgi:cell division protein FtsI/penicillin-binding protein 2
MSIFPFPRPTPPSLSSPHFSLVSQSTQVFVLFAFSSLALSVFHNQLRYNKSNNELKLDPLSVTQQHTRADTLDRNYDHD